MVRKILRSRLLRRLAKQTVGLKRVPEPLQESIKGYLADYSNHQIRQHVFNYTLMLSSKSEEPPTAVTPAFEPSAKVLAAVEDYFSNKGPFAPVPKKYRTARLKPRYDEKQVAAYVAAKMPAVYSVIHTVLSEVARRLPDFKPENVLDYGSGPGTSIWAMSQVWPKTVKLVNMVETSPSMLAASKKILEDLEDPPVMHNHKTLRILSKKTRHSGHDIVIACHAIGELPTVEEQITTARQLWALTRDILVIVEPGTSEGSLTVRGIRAHILALERKKLRRRRKFLTGSTSTDTPMIGTSEEDGNKRNLDEQLVVHSEEEVEIPGGGAHVIAPCPHDGVCPMDGTTVFCHFVQRLERTFTQRMAKKHSRTMLRGYEDEKYSYVVLRRGHRPRVDWPLDHVELQLDKDEPVENDLLVDYEEDEDEEEEEYLEDENDEDRETRDDDEGDIETKMEEEPGEDENEDQIEEQEGDDDECKETAANMSSGWGRVIFKPFRRGKHVTLDVCRSTSPDGSSGSFDRLTVTRAKHRVLHKEAKKVRWGDLWAATSSTKTFRHTRDNRIPLSRERIHSYE
ncbi:uncharacterized protein LOC9632673 [Selaginella moellendorffii]|uniref:uncharacterized protein LOC9632673 n=1 Tax=Selaginella moellendorffii TaxID=88036 RepID=UPI000D1C34B7|nr:uncharacterized protein LOC9632673 [Selaginella moellendorffii]|eukprot:XP_024531076.1 uncharacterized protein LOC9632673 [Selaginella moellendorffii]